MTCNICRKEKAVLHITEQIGKEFYQIVICKQCNKELKITEKCFEYLDYNGKLFSIFQNYERVKSSRKKNNNIEKKRYNKICNVCGYSLNDFLITKNAACPKCYDSFGAFVDKIVKKIHHANKHIGKISNRNLSNEDIEKEISKYRYNMELLKKMEKYEEANELKKKIKNLNEVLIFKNSEKIEEKI